MKAAVISRVLKANGFSRSQEATTRIKGWHTFSAGFVVAQRATGVVVEYELGNWNRSENVDELYSDKLSSYADFLSKKGYAAEVVNNQYVWVTKKAVA